MHAPQEDPVSVYLREASKLHTPPADGLVTALGDARADEPFRVAVPSLDDEQLHCLALTLAAPSVNMTALRLQNGTYGVDGLQALAGALSCCERVQLLDLSSTPLQDDGVAALCRGLNERRTIGSGGSGALTPRKSCGLTELDLSRSGMSTYGLEVLVNTVALMPDIATLRLEDNGLPREAGPILGKAAKGRHGGVACLFLRGNDLGDFGTAGFAGALGAQVRPHNGAAPLAVKLRHLDLSANGIGDAGVEALCNGLRKLSSLSDQQHGQHQHHQHQRRESHSHGAAAAAAAAAAPAAGPCTLRHLELSNNTITDDGAAALSRLLGEAGEGLRLECLGLADNNIGAGGATQLLTSVGTSSASLRVLDLTRAEVTAAVLRTAGAVLSQNSSLEQLFLVPSSSTAERMANDPYVKTEMRASLSDLMVGSAGNTSLVELRLGAITDIFGSDPAIRALHYTTEINANNVTGLGGGELQRERERERHKRSSRDSVAGSLSRTMSAASNTGTDTSLATLSPQQQQERQERGHRASFSSASSSVSGVAVGVQRRGTGSPNVQPAAPAPLSSSQQSHLSQDSQDSSADSADSADDILRQAAATLRKREACSGRVTVLERGFREALQATPKPLPVRDAPLPHEDLKEDDENKEGQQQRPPQPQPQQQQRQPPSLQSFTLEQVTRIAEEASRKAVAAAALSWQSQLRESVALAMKEKEARWAAGLAEAQQQQREGLQQLREGLESLQREMKWVDEEALRGKVEAEQRQQGLADQVRDVSDRTGKMQEVQEDVVGRLDELYRLVIQEQQQQQDQDEKFYDITSVLTELDNRVGELFSRIRPPHEQGGDNANGTVPQDGDKTAGGGSDVAQAQTKLATDLSLLKEEWAAALLGLESKADTKRSIDKRHIEGRCDAVAKQVKALRESFVKLEEDNVAIIEALLGQQI